MKTSRIEEMADDLVDNQLPEHIISVSNAEEAKGVLVKALTEAHQAGRCEMAEHIIGILKRSYLLTNGYKDTDITRTAMYIENEDFNIAINKRLDFFIEQIEKALQDNK